MIRHQKTIGKEIAYRGVGLHSGLPVQMTLKPAPEHTGIVFVRTDLDGAPQVRAHIRHVTNTMRATTLEDGAAKVFTVEHVLSAFYALEVDNCYIEMDGPEPPVADGSGLVFGQLIQEAGIVEQKAKCHIHKVQKSYGIYDGDRFVLVTPYEGLRISFTSINSHPLLGTQFADFEITPETYMKEIGPARTIGFTHEIEKLQALGLAKGGNTDNCIVYDDETCLSTLRYDDELVRHKILDVLGDISLIGPMEGHIIALKSSHELNARLSRAILKEMNEQ